MFSCGTSAPLHCSLRGGLPCFFRVNEAWNFPRLTQDDYCCFTLCLKKKNLLSRTGEWLLMGENQPFVCRKKWKWVLMTPLGSEVERDSFCAASSKIPHVLEISRHPHEFLTLQWRKITWRETQITRKKRAEILEFEAYPDFSNFRIWRMFFSGVKYPRVCVVRLKLWHGSTRLSPRSPWPI